jgi:hypothetical protein
MSVAIKKQLCHCIAVGDPTHAWGCPNDSDAEMSSSDSDESNDETPTPPRQVKYVDHGPNYPKGVVQRPHPGECNNIYSTCNLEFEHSDDGTLREVLDDECGHTDGVYHGGGFDTGRTWNTKPHEVYIDSALWGELSQGQKNIITDHAGIACPTCGMTNQVLVTDVFDKAWRSD